MQGHKLSIYFIFCFGLIVLACNPTKDKWLNRNWHTFTARFNVYFNGELKFNEAIDVLQSGHQDDFTRILEVFPYGDEASSKAIAGQMDEVLKKVSLSIQNHTIGRYTDDSYLLMGKAHFFKRDYYASMEAFQYINSKYKDQGLRPISTCWIAKCYTGLKKTEEAEAVIGLILAEEAAKAKGSSVLKKAVGSSPKEYSREIYATAADIAIKQGKYSTAIVNLKKALSFTHKKPLKIRYTYILGQLYLQADSIQLANKYFSKILNMLAPYEFEFNANLNLAKAYNEQDKAASKRIRKSLKRMLRDEKNDGYYDQIWYELGNLEMREKNLQGAINAYKMSTGITGKNPNQKALSHLALANIYFGIPDYRLAQAYYDSAASGLNESYKDYQRIIDKKTVLNELINNLVVIETQDSLQKLSKLSSSELDLKIEQWIAAAKLDSVQQVKLSKERKQIEKNKLAVAEQNAANGVAPTIGGQGAWYFYNPTLMASGRAEFSSLKRWGNRTNEDLWRYASIEKTKPEPTTIEDESQTNSEKKPNSKQVEDTVQKKVNPNLAINSSKQAWIADVPFTEAEFNKSQSLMMEAYYNIGVMYDEKLGDFKEAIINYDALIKRFPNCEYEPEVLYRLFKLYTIQQSTTFAASTKDQLVSKYPESPYALLVQNKSITSAETDANKEVVDFYERMYSLYAQGEFETVKLLKKEADKKYAGNALQPKFDLLNALAIGKTQPETQFAQELEAIVAAYPKTDVADRAAAILYYLKNKNNRTKDTVAEIQPEFVIESGAPYYYVLVLPNDKEDLNELLSKMNAYNEEYNQFESLRVNPMLSNEGFSMVMVREFTEFAKAEEYYNNIVILDAVKKRFKYTETYSHFVISQSNFKKMLKEKKATLYLTIFDEYYQNKKTKK